MNELTIKAPAKINIYLDVVGKRPDGYHELQTVMQSISLYDEVSVTKIPCGIQLTCDKDYIPTDERNIAYKAAKAFKDKFEIKDGVKIHLEKKIPVGSGLGGGSVDAASVLLAMDHLFEASVKKEELIELGKSIGADVPFCLLGKTALAEGIGERLTQISNSADWDIVLIKPRFSISTAMVYKNYKMQERPPNVSAKGMIDALESGSVTGVASNMYNALESVACNEYPEIEHIKKRLIEAGAKGALMSGSGSSVFGLFEDKESAKDSYGRFRKKYQQVYLVKMI